MELRKCIHGLLWCAIWTCVDSTALLKVLSFPNSCFITLTLYHWHQGRLDYVLQRKQKETYSHCTSVSSLLLVSPLGYLQYKTYYIKSNSSLFVRPVIMHSQTTNMGVGCDGVNVCCYYANYAFHVDLHIIVTNKTFMFWKLQSWSNSVAQVAFRYVCLHR